MNDASYPLPGTARARVNKVLARAFYGVYFVTFGWVVLNIAFTTTQNNIANMALAAVMFFGLCLLYRFCAPWVDALPKRRLYIMVGVGLGVYLIVQLVMGWFMMILPTTDLEWVLEAVGEVVEDGHLGAYYNNYFQQYPNNFGLMLFLLGLTRTVSAFGFGIDSDFFFYAGTVINVIGMNLALFLVWRAAGLLFKKQSTALLALLMGMLFAPFILWAPYFYTDSLSLAFPVGAVVLYLAARQRQGKAAFWRYALCGLVLVGGTIIKGSVALVLVAILLHLVLTLPVKGLKTGWPVPAALILCVFLLFNSLFTLYTDSRPWFDAAGKQEVKNPISMWLAMGSHEGDGFCVCEECYAVRRIESYDERSAAAWDWMMENYAGYTETELTAFLTYKAVRAWGSGSYEAFEFIRLARHGNWTHSFILREGALYAPVNYWANAYNLALLAALMVAVLGFMRTGRFAGVSVVHLLLFGVFLFFLFWENQIRYIFPFTPLLIIAAAGGLSQLAQRLPLPTRKPKPVPAAGAGNNE